MLLATTLLPFVVIAIIFLEVQGHSLPIQISNVSDIHTETTTLTQVDIDLPTKSSELAQKITFNSLSFRDPVTGGLTPPDPSGAAGPSSVISVANAAIQAMDRLGNVTWNAPLPSFFASIRESLLVFDPKIVYDVHEGNFAVAALELDFDCSKRISNILLAVSTNSNPNLTDWRFKKINAFSNGNWADYPGFEVDEEVMYITANMWSCSSETFSNSKLWIVQKNDLSSQAFESFPGSQEFTYQPAEVRANKGAGKHIGTYLVSLSKPYPQQSISIVQIKYPTGKVIFDHKYVSLGTIDFPITSSLQAPQLGSYRTLHAGVDPTFPRYNIYDAAWNKYSIWMVSTMLRNGEATAVWLQVNVSSWEAPTVMQFGEITGEDISAKTHTFYPSLAVNKNGVAAFGFSASGKSIYAGAYFTWRRNTDNPGKTRQAETVRAGVSPYYVTKGGPLNRWGDYTGISVDPANENCFWVYNQFADTPCYNNSLGDRGCWTTAWAQYCVKT